MYTNESDLRDSGLLDRYSKSYGLENLETVQTKGDEWYIVIPRHSKATVKVNAVEIDENCNLHKSMLLAERDGRPFLLRCNVSDLYCNVAISIEGKDGKPLVDYSPMISLKDGKAFVRLSRGIDECPEGEYEIEDLSGKCRGVFIGNIGQDINPIVCLAMENGGLEIFSLFSATQTGRFDSSGPLDGFKEIELTPSLNAEISFLQNNDDGKITEHKIVITQDWKITYSTSWFEGDPIEEYRGRIRPLKADYDNHVFEYSYVFFERLHYSQDMMATSEKINLAGSFRHTSDNSGYLVTPLSGPLTFGAQDTGSVFYEYTYLRDMPQSDSGEEAE